MEARARAIMGRFSTPLEGRKAYVKWLHDELKGGTSRAVEDWNDNTANAALMRYLTSDEDLRQALLETFPPDEDLINGLYKAKGDRLPKGRTAPKDGYYCKVCGGPVGDTTEEVIKNGLLCSYHPDGENHPFGMPYSPLG